MGLSKAAPLSTHWLSWFPTGSKDSTFRVRYCGVLMLDFSKAFDKVDHSILLQKLANTGVPDCVTRWFTAFLCECRQHTKIGDYVSDWCTINAGVPQGTLLGPVGFVIHIIDLQTCLPTFKYVDGSTLWEVCSANATDSLLQCAATAAVQWSNDNLMSVNCDKTKELLVSFARSKLDIPPITINGKSIEHVSTAKLLGVTFSSDLTWDAHIKVIHSKASQRLYFLRLLHRAGVGSGHIVHIYQSLIRSLLEYACPVWHCALLRSLADKLEGLQRRALRIALPNCSYSEALQRTGMPTLADRRDDLSRGFFQAMLSPSNKLNHLLPTQRKVCYGLRSLKNYGTMMAKQERFKKTLIPYGLTHWQ